jgi:HTH-type transcriptional regulator/antitoxin HipB
LHGGFTFWPLLSNQDGCCALLALLAQASLLTLLFLSSKLLSPLKGSKRMRYPLETSQQLSAVLKALRHSRNLTQAELGEQLGVNQKRVARIEATPGVTSFDQIARLVALMGHRLVLEALPSTEPLSADKEATSW